MKDPMDKVILEWYLKRKGVETIKSIPTPKPTLKEIIEGLYLGIDWNIKRLFGIKRK